MNKQIKELNRDPGNKSAHIQSIDLWRKKEDKKVSLNGERLIFSTYETGKTGHPHAKNNNPDRDITSFTKINSKWVTDLNVKCKTIKLLEDDIE